MGTPLQFAEPAIEARGTVTLYFHTRHSFIMAAWWLTFVIAVLAVCGLAAPTTKGMCFVRDLGGVSDSV